jgi:hypothetical protein
MAAAEKASCDLTNISSVDIEEKVAIYFMTTFTYLSTGYLFSWSNLFISTIMVGLDRHNITRILALLAWPKDMSS